jgi:hypothetical protein
VNQNAKKQKQKNGSRTANWLPTKLFIAFLRGDSHASSPTGRISTGSSSLQRREEK